MDEIEIIEIAVLETGEISITPSVNWNNSFQFIYRAATGVIWSESR